MQFPKVKGQIKKSPSLSSIFLFPLFLIYVMSISITCIPDRPCDPAVGCHMRHWSLPTSPLVHSLTDHPLRFDSHIGAHSMRWIGHGIQLGEGRKNSVAPPLAHGNRTVARPVCAPPVVHRCHGGNMAKRGNVLMLLSHEMNMRWNKAHLYAFPSSLCYL